MFAPPISQQDGNENNNPNSISYKQREIYKARDTKVRSENAQFKYHKDP
jgi:hypothetical protein